MSRTSEPDAAQPLSADELADIDAWWRAANYLTVGQIYLLANPLLREPLRPEHVKPRLLGHWGTTPGLNLLYAHVNRLIRAARRGRIVHRRARTRRPGDVREHVARGLVHASTGPRSRRTRRACRSSSGSSRFRVECRATSRPRRRDRSTRAESSATRSATRTVPRLDNPDLLVACVIGDGEAETGPLAASWHANKFLDPATDGAVLPILHLNGWKIANPDRARPHRRRRARRAAAGLRASPDLRQRRRSRASCTRQLAAAMDEAYAEIRRFQRAAREHGASERPRWPMIVLRTPKGWTGP